jgi:hypothetical protein
MYSFGPDLIPSSRFIPFVHIYSRRPDLFPLAILNKLTYISNCEQEMEMMKEKEKQKQREWEKTYKKRKEKS